VGEHIMQQDIGPADKRLALELLEFAHQEGKA
jgi:hypothetical protein